MIKLNDVLRIEDLSNVKVRFNLMFNNNWDPIEDFKNGKDQIMLEGQYWNYKSKKSFKEGQITIGFVRISRNDNLWLLFHIGRVIKDLEKMDGVGYEFEVIPEYEKYFGRLIVRFKNKSQTMIRWASSVMDECEVAQILPDIFDNDIFPGYENVNLSWEELSRVIEKDNWKTALQNQKGVYLITDISNGKRYVGSAAGDEMILQRWRDYVKNGNGGNEDFKNLDFGHIKENFRYSILDIYKSTVDKQTILQRESWWKRVLLTRGKYGYNKN